MLRIFAQRKMELAQWRYHLKKRLELTCPGKWSTKEPANDNIDVRRERIVFVGRNIFQKPYMFVVYVTRNVDFSNGRIKEIDESIGHRNVSFECSVMAEITPLIYRTIADNETLDTINEVIDFIKNAIQSFIPPNDNDGGDDNPDPVAPKPDVRTRSPILV